MKKKILVGFLLLLLLAIVKDFTYTGDIKNGYIDRDPIGGEEADLQLQLEVDGVIENYDYSIKVVPELPTEDEAEKYFQDAIFQIEKEFVDISTIVPLQKEYVNGFVQANWSFQPFGIVKEDGEIIFEKVDTEVVIIHAQVELRCGNYEKIYVFSFEAKEPKPSEAERIIQEVEEWFHNQMNLEGSKVIQLPSEIAGKKLLWIEKREFITPQVFCLELLALLLLQFVSKRKKEEEKNKLISEMESDYPEIINQLSLLMSVGMTTRQAWSRIAMQYEYKREKGLIPEKRVYEAILQMHRRFNEGESERIVYKRFIEDIPAVSYRKLIRLLLGNMEKGSSEIVIRLEDENRQAFEQKIIYARKLGEEASTKMLLPLILMLLLVMGVVLLPALIKFKI